MVKDQIRRPHRLLRRQGLSVKTLQGDDGRVSSDFPLNIQSVNIQSVVSGTKGGNAGVDARLASAKSSHFLDPLEQTMARHFPMALPLRILLAGDSGDETSLLERAFGPAVPEYYDLVRVADLESALKLLADQRFDVVLLDIALPDASSFDALLSIQNLVPDLPIIFLTNAGDESAALAAMRRGAQDYLLKDHADARAIKRAIQCAIHRKQFEEVLITQANYDGLTGLANRTLFESRLDMALARMKRKEGGVSVFFLDLNRFKQVNDTHGHAAGDRLLQEVAERLKRSVREYDTVARFGGDEFAVLIEASGLAQDYLAVAAKIIHVFESEPFAIENTQARVGVSIGISTCVSASGVTRERLMKQADFAMYEAKRTRQSTYRVFGEEVTEARRELQHA